MVGRMDSVFSILYEDGITALVSGEPHKIVASVMAGRDCDPSALEMLTDYLISGQPTAMNGMIVTQL